MSDSTQSPLRWILCIIILLGGFGECRAASFWDWLWGRSPYYQPGASFLGIPSSSSRPAYPVAAPVPTAGTLSAQAVGATGCTPGSTSAQACLPAATAVQVARPQVFARSTWLRVPVTTYRPMAVTDPRTGAAVSQLQPCNYYTWQLRRVPVASPGPPWRAPAMPQPALRSAPAACGCEAPSSVQPPARAEPYYVPSTGSPIPAPALSPGTPVPGAAPQDAPPRGPSNLQPTPDPTAGTQAFSRPSAGQQRSRSDVSPILDPNAADRESPAESSPNREIPQLLDPQNHTARRPWSRWDIATAAWPAQQPAAAVPREGLDLNPPTRGRPAAGRWDDHGWNAARP